MIRTFRRLFGSDRLFASMTRGEWAAVVVQLNLEAGQLAWGW